MSLKIKLISVVSAFILVLSMLLVGVLAATGSFTINLKGNVEFNIDDSNLYIKDIRLSDGQTEGETIKNFMPGFVGESFELDFGSISSDSGSVSIEINVINTTETTYSASSQSSLSNATLTVSGTIAGDSVPLDQVATFDGISGTIYISVQVTSSTTINLNNIVIDIAEQTSFTATFSHHGGRDVYVMGDDGVIHTLTYSGSNDSLELETSYISIASDSSYLTQLSALNNRTSNGLVIEDVELYAPGGGSFYITANGMGYDEGHYYNSFNDNLWYLVGSPAYIDHVSIDSSGYVLTYTLTENTDFILEPAT